jgi:hypothetical protein
MIFNIDENVLLSTVMQSLEDASSQMSEEQANKITEEINNGVPGLIAILTQGMAQHWKDEAMNSGTGWGSKYAAAITYRIDNTTGEIFLDEKIVDEFSNKPNIMFAKMVEEGVKSWSIKDALLASEHAKIGKNGVKYIVIPMPVAVPKATPGARGKQFGGREMSQEVHAIVKSGGKYSGQLAGGQEVSGLTKYVTRQHHEGYGSFVCVTEDSKGWKYPTIGATPVFPRVLEEVNRRIDELVSVFCEEVVKRFS